MDAYQQSHRYTRPPLPPLPSMADPHHHLHLQPPPPRHSVPSQGPWYSGQFQYHPSSPPPPPHQQQPPQWAPPPHSDHLPPPPYPAPHHNPLPPYPAHQTLHNQFPPPPRPHLPPPPPPHPHHPHSQTPQSYSQVNQEWGNPNWAHHQGWEYPAHNNEEDWAARARAWAAAKAAMDNQHPQSQFTPVGRPEEQSQYHDQYPQAVDPHYPETQQQPLPASSYQQFPVPTAPSYRPPVVHLQESASISSGPMSYVPDGRLPYTARDGTLAGDSNAMFPHQESLHTSPTVHQQEVPSSYSSVTGKEAADQTEQLYKSLPFPITSAQEGQHHVQSSVPAVGRSILMEQPFAYGNHSADFSPDLADQPLDFAPRFNRDHDPHMQSSYAHPDSAGPIRGMDPVAAVPSIHTWTPPIASGVVYPPIPPVLPSGPQHDPSVAVPSPVHGHAAPVFGRIPGPSFQPTIPSVSAPFSLGSGTALHPTTAFPGDAYGVSSISERPRKASVPNWLREEIIKKKAVMASSAQEHPKEETQSIEDEDVDKSLVKGDQADSKSIDSSRSIEEEDDDEDYVEAAKTAAINQEIKRVLTEVLLKVTDELFDEIATKVLNEDDLTVEVDHSTVTSNRRVSPSPPAVPTPKASAKVLIPVKSKETETKDVSGKSSSSSPGDVLGLSSYASDDDDDDEIQSSSVRNSRKNPFHQQSSIKKHSEDIHDAVENGSSQAEIELNRDQTNLENDSSKTSPIGAKNNHSAAVSGLEDGNVGPTYSSKVVSGVIEDEISVGGEMLDGINASESKYNVGEKVLRKPELTGENVNAKKLMPDDSQGRETRIKSDKNDRYETKRSSAVKDFVKEAESGKIRADERGDENRGRQDERHLKKDKTDDWNGSKERRKERGAKPQEKAKESDSRKKSTHLDVKEDRKETERGKRASAKEDNEKKRERAKDEKEDRSRHKPASDSSRHKRRRSPSTSSRGRNGKDNSVVSHVNDSSDEASEDSKRKLHSKRHDLSPSPVRSRRRQVSRSPHSKHSQRRHSPYSSLETTRKRR